MILIIKLINIGGLFNLDQKKIRLKDIEVTMSDPNFWNDIDKSKKISSELSSLKSDIDSWEAIKIDVKNSMDWLDLLENESDDSLFDEFKVNFSIIEKKFLDLERYLILSKEGDINNAFISINAGAGGTEACDWTSMLYRMYYRWAEIKGFSCELVDILHGDEAGVKNLTLLIKGKYAYGFLRGESGVHRLVRISPFDSNSRRHTSFASVYVLPEVSGDIVVDLKTADLKIDTYRAQGAGGQHVNTTDSAVRITHLPTGVVVQCQSEKSQHKNKANAMKVLKSRLYKHYQQESKKKLEKSNPEKLDITWGSQIRSYVFQPYVMVKDHRTNFETGDGQGMLDGRLLDSFINRYLQYNIKS